ncbi:MAG: M48 family metallopeptidase [Gammaproteobacteria bacterium]|nr:M48 family metallopeptidase [Gammaproteobacteria bacterium]
MLSYPRRLLLLGLLCLSPSLPSLALDLPNIGDPAERLITPDQERQLGEAFMRRLRQQVPLIDDPELNTYISTLGNRLVANSDTPGQRFTFFIVKDSAINAFAAPGGFIGTHSALILAARNESELAGVLAHEIAHVTQKHLVRAYDSASRMGLPMAAALLAAILIGTQDTEAGQAALMSVQAGAIQQQINFTRANESEADHIGMQTLARSEFDPRGMPGFFERLQQSTRLYGDGLPPFLSTHPVTTDRIAESMARAEQTRPQHIQDSLNFYLAQAKLRALTTADAKQAVAYFNQPKTDPPLPEAAREYGHALALARADDYAAARTILTRLGKTDPDRIAYPLALAQLDLSAGRNDAALEQYRTLLRLYPTNAVLVEGYTQALLNTGRHGEARQLLEEARRRQAQPDPGLYLLLAKAATGMKREADAHEAMAEYYYLNGQTFEAVEQLTLASRIPGQDFYQASRIEARLQELEAIALEEKAKADENEPR